MAECLPFVIPKWLYSWASGHYKLMAFPEFLAMMPVTQDDVSGSF